MISFEDFVLGDGYTIYLQIIRHIKKGISAGAIGHQEEVPSRRALSALLGVNPNTIQKAYHMLEDEGIIVSRSGAKSYTSVDEDTVQHIRRELQAGDTAVWVEAMKRLGLSRDQALGHAADHWQKGPENRKHWICGGLHGLRAAKARKRQRQGTGELESAETAGIRCFKAVEMRGRGYDDDGREMAEKCKGSGIHMGAAGQKQYL